MLNSEQNEAEDAHIYGCKMILEGFPVDKIHEVSIAIPRVYLFCFYFNSDGTWKEVSTLRALWNDASAQPLIRILSFARPMQNLDLAFEEEKAVVELEAKARVIQERNDLINRYKKNLDQLVVAKNEAANKEYRLLLGQTLEAARTVRMLRIDQ